jgi:hypothetical protein
MDTITPGDYTMQMEITEKMYMEFIEKHYKRNPDQNRIGKEPIAMEFKKYIKEHLERQLNEEVKRENPKHQEY